MILDEGTDTDPPRPQASPAAMRNVIAALVKHIERAKCDSNLGVFRSSEFFKTLRRAKDIIGEEDAL